MNYKIKEILELRIYGRLDDGQFKLLKTFSKDDLVLPKDNKGGFLCVTQVSQKMMQ